MLGSFQLRLMVAAMVVIVAPGLLAAPALAVVLPEEITTALNERFDGFIEAGGFTEENAAPLTGENWYARTDGGSPVEIIVPDALGEYEMRYVVDQSNRASLSFDGGHRCDVRSPRRPP